MSNISGKDRLYHIDRLKVLGLFLVILAHVDLPLWLAKLRSFDVPLLVFVSAYLARRTYKGDNIISYYKKRFVRLAVPAWIFACFFWIVQSIVLSPPTFADIIMGVTFQRDTNLLGMLWVIWVYIVCALLIPIISKMNNSFKTHFWGVLLLILYQVLCSCTLLSENRVLYCTIFTAIPYGFITYLGYWYSNMNTKNKYTLSLGSLLVFCLMTLGLWLRNGNVFPVTDYKYPAQIYYLCYAIPIVVLLFELLPRFDKYKASRIVQFISKSSLWIYLWHILILYAVKMIIENPAYWWLQYMIVIVISVCVTWIQNKAVDCLIAKFKWKVLMIFKG